MSVEIKDLAVEYAKTFEQFKTFIDRKEVEQKSFNTTLSDTRESLNKVNAKLEQLELKLNKPQFERRDYNPVSEAKQALLKIARGKDLTPDERKNVYSSVDTAGGYLVPEEMSKSIIEVATEISPMRSLATIVNVTTDTYISPKRTANLTASWTAENGSRSADTTLAHGQVRIPVYELYARIPVSFQALEDSAFDLESLLNRWAGEAFGYSENSAFISGNGVGKPMGFLNDGGITTLNCGSTSTLSADKLIDLTQKLKQPNLNNSTWLFNRTVAAAIRELKAATSNTYLWVDSVNNLVQGLPPSLIGRPWMIAPDMPDIASAAKSVVLGDFKAGYCIADRVNMSFVKDIYTDASNGNAVMCFRKRVGGAVTDGSAIAALVMST